MPKERTHGAFIYPRFSTEHQHSIEEQVDACSRRCKELGLAVLGIYADEAVSGTKLSRRNFDRMMDDLRAGLADTVVIYDQSRLMRDIEGWFAVRKELQLMGVRVISATQEFVGGDIRKSDNFMMESIQATFDQMHVLITREKVTAKLHYMAKAGLHTGGVPALGYRTKEIGDGKKILEVDEKEAAIVRRIFRAYDSGQSYKSIIDSLNADGIRTKRGNKFGANSLHDLLKNNLYTGVQIYGAKVYRPDGTRNSHAPEGQNIITRDAPELAIIDKTTFERVQQRMAQNKHQQAGRPPEARNYPLKGKVFCGECGSAMNVAASKKHEYLYYYYRCAKKDRTHDCTCRPIRCDDLEQLVVDYVRGLIGCPEIKDRAMEYLRREADAINKTGIDRLKSMQQEQRAIKSKIDNIIAAIEDGNYIPTMRDRLKQLEAEKASIESKINSLSRSASVAALPSEKFEAAYKKLCTTAQTNTTAILSIVSRVEIYNDCIKIYTLFNPDHDNTGPDETRGEFIEIPGTPSGVPRIIINFCGITLMIPRGK